MLLDRDIPAKPLRPRPAKGFRISRRALSQRTGRADQVVKETALGERFGHRRSSSVSLSAGRRRAGIPRTSPTGPRILLAGARGCAKSVTLRILCRSAITTLRPESVARQAHRREVVIRFRLDNGLRRQLAREHRQIPALPIQGIDELRGITDHHGAVRKTCGSCRSPFRDEVTRVLELSPPRPAARSPGAP